MDANTLSRIRQFTDSTVADIQKSNQRRIEAERRTLDIEVQKLAEAKAWELLSVKIQNCEKLKQLKKERAKLHRETVDYFKEFLFWTGVQLSRTTPALFILALSGVVGCGLGVFIGLNAFPSAIACPTVRSWCYHLRLNKETTLAPEIPDDKHRQVAPLKKKSRKRS